MRILWFNWRDIRNPEAGGAEVFTHEVMKRLANRGCEMTLFTSRFRDCQLNENINGVDIIREGNKYTVYKEAKNYLKAYKDHYDVIIDEINTVPFFVPKSVREKKVIAVIHQLAREFWFYETKFPVNYVGYYYLEKKWLSNYKNTITLALSNSTKIDLEELGFKRVFVVPPGLNVTPLSNVKEKEANPTVVFMGRLKKAKLPHHALKAFSIIKREINDAKMWVIGDGYFRKKLESFTIKDVTFYGYISSEKKYDLLSRAHIILVPAVREGWGLVVTEANAMGTPAIGYDVPGLRDSIRHGETGINVMEKSPAAMAQQAISLLRDSDRLSKYSRNALEFSRQFSWDNTVNLFEKIINSQSETNANRATS
ncbi:MAG TPA: glycosyltransferase family 4 protein [Nitrososphaeraceae archaeon]|nr:glycosyltransferase family 4 protein [Nitrososphaeraceae archaeon]